VKRSEIISILCDNCKRCLILTDDITVFEKAGWKAVKVNFAWKDFCSEECLKEYEVVVKK
jgi:hypothetical protein